MHRENVMSEAEGAGQGVGSSLPVPAIVAAVIAVVVVIAGFTAYAVLSLAESDRTLVIATGSESGTYHALGVALGSVLEAQGIVNKAEVLPTDGSVANMQLIGGAGRGADLAFVQSDTKAGQLVRLVAPLYDEVLHILVAREVADRVASIYDLTKLRVSVGPPGSGTRQLTEQVLEHFGVGVGQALALSPPEAAAGLADGSVDVAFLLTSIPSRIIDSLAAADAVRFLSLGDAQEYGTEADGLALVLPSVRGFTIPRSTYMRLPEKAVRTVSVSALLVARRDLDPELVQEITETLLEYRGGAGRLEGDELVVAQQIHEDYRPSAFLIPFHRGSVAYYQREDPPFFVAYAEAISLGLTLLVGAYSGYVALREWMKRRMKNRIDAYLLEVEQHSKELRSMSLEELIGHRDALDEIRRKAFADLVSERVLANESFSIFQNHLRDEYSALEARIAEKKLAV
jgi:TRAP transporter TAXI family solute receptor